ERFCLLREPAAEISETDDVIAVVGHLRRRRQAQRPCFGQQQEAIFGGRRDKRGSLFAPVWDQLVEGSRVEHGAGEDVWAATRALLDDANTDLLSAPPAPLFSP